MRVAFYFASLTQRTKPCFLFFRLAWDTSVESAAYRGIYYAGSFDSKHAENHPVVRCDELTFKTPY